MGEIFDIIENTAKKEGGEKEARLGLRLSIGGHDDIFPISTACNSYEAIEIEVKKTKNSLDRVLDKAKAFFRGSTIQDTLGITPDMGPEKIWDTLSNVVDEDFFINNFNSMEESIRRGVAEHVLTQCNIFSGKASIFSTHYDNETGLLE